MPDASKANKQKRHRVWSKERFIDQEGASLRRWGIRVRHNLIASTNPF